LLCPTPPQARLLAQSVTPRDAQALGTLRLVRAIYGRLRHMYPAPGMAWYATNMAVQVGNLSLCAEWMWT